jgi:addiction module RelE/StbE family toxin
MQLSYTKTFKKQFKKLPKQWQTEFQDRLALFLQDQSLPQLRVHPLIGNYAGYWSMSVNGDVRALYRKDGDSVIIFALIGTHSQLYG